MKKKWDVEAKRSKRLRKGDKVFVLSGNDRGQVGTVLSIQGRRALVQGINMRKKCMRPTQASPKGTILNRECYVDSSNLRLCTEEETPLKVSVREDNKGKHFVYQKEGKDVIYRTLKEVKSHD